MSTIGKNEKIWFLPRARAKQTTPESNKPHVVGKRSILVFKGALVPDELGLHTSHGSTYPRPLLTTNDEYGDYLDHDLRGKHKQTFQSKTWKHVAAGVTGRKQQKRQE